jgi:hypothetical protein
MSTIKISQLPAITSLNANTSNNILIGVDLQANVTGRITTTTLASGLYSNNILNVGSAPLTFPNLIAQFAYSSNNYIQTNLQNINNDNGTADHVITANTGTDSNYYIDLGYANKNYNNLNPYNSLGNILNPLDGYLYVQGGSSLPGGNLIIGTTTTGANVVVFAGGVTANQQVLTISNTSLTILRDTLFTGNTITNKIISPLGSNTNIIIDPDGYGDVIFPINTEVFFQSGAPALSNTIGSIVVTGGIAATGNIYSGGVYITGSANGLTFADGTKQSTAGLANTSGATFGGTLKVSNGILFVPNVFPGAQTSITIDFTNNAIVRAQTNSAISVSLTNLVGGKEVSLWLTNTNTTTQILTHGVSAVNSSVGATTYTIPATSTINIRYGSTDGTVQNTFAAIIHA